MIRTRFAPSPTGYLHVGGLRTALYNYLFAKKYQGIFVLRIEDTDQHRKVEGAVENLISTLDWAGIHPDEGPVQGGEFGPYIQSQRLDLYRKYVDMLVEKGYAYPCFCTKERLDTLRKSQEEAGNGVTGYDGYCRNISVGEARQRIAAGEEYVIRLKTPDSGEVIIDDLVRGRVITRCEEIDDQVLLKSDGFPTYHLANVVDDHSMGITHVIRGEEWLPSTPKHLLMYQYFGWGIPQFAHLPLLLNADRTKLSKRQGDVAAEDYRIKGYLPEALINFLLFMGWNPGDEREMFSLPEMVEEFSLEKVGKSGSVFNPDKLNWFNGHYIRNTETAVLVPLSREFFPEQPELSDERKSRILEFFKNRLEKLSDLVNLTEDLYKTEIAPESEEVAELVSGEEGKTVMTALLTQLQTVENFDGNAFIQMIKTVQKETGIKGKTLWMSARAGLTGQAHGPDLNQVAELLGREICISRLKQMLEKR